MAFEGPVEDRLAIHELVASYADAVSRNDPDDWGALWADDAVWELPFIPGMEHIVGREAIVSAWIEAMTAFPSIVAIAPMGALNIDGDSATGRAYPTELCLFDDGTSRRDTGRYDDEYVKINGRWYFQKRVYSSLHSG